MIDNQVNYLGLVSVIDFITGEDLALKVGLEEGVSQHSDTDWVKMSVGGTTLLFPQKPIRHSVSWDDLASLDLIYGNTTILVNGLAYEVRLFKGSNSDPHNRYNHDLDIGFNVSTTRRSEWNRLMYPIHSNRHTNSVNHNADSYEFGTLKYFNDTDLNTHHNSGYGSACWCQELDSFPHTRRVVRGYLGVSHMQTVPLNIRDHSVGWRPILELVTTKKPLSDHLEEDEIKLLESLDLTPIALVEFLNETKPFDPVVLELLRGYLKS